MNIKKFLSVSLTVLIVSCVICNNANAASSQNIETKKRQTREKIQHLKWLERVETNKLYKNQQKLESATTNLKQSKSEIVSAQRELDGMQSKLNSAYYEYNSLNTLLEGHIRKVYKTQR